MTRLFLDTPLRQAIHTSVERPFIHSILIELIAPVPLLIFGVVGLLHPLGVSLALIFALLPWAVRLWTGGRLTRPAIISGPLLL